MVNQVINQLSYLGARAIYLDKLQSISPFHLHMCWFNSLQSLYLHEIIKSPLSLVNQWLINGYINPIVLSSNRLTSLTIDSPTVESLFHHACWLKQLT